jgi:hypothetical protein
MHDLFVDLFLETGGDELLAEEERERRARRAWRGRSRHLMTVSGRPRERR